jgi:thymidine kinase
MTKNKIYDVTQLSKEYGIDTMKVRYIKDIPIDVIRRYNYIAVDEAQFFEDIEMILYLVDDLKKYVRVVGLNGDKDRNVFGNVFRLLPHVDGIEFLTAICSECGRVGTKSKAIFTRLKITENNDVTSQIKIGTDIFEPLCRDCYNKLNR